MRRFLQSCVLLASLVAVHAQAVPAAVPVVDERVSSALALPVPLRQALMESGFDRSSAQKEQIQKLIDFMLGDKGLALRYQEQPTYSIAESYSRRRVNCLSFTLMFVALARASGMRVRVQASDVVREAWATNDLVFRAAHVSAVVEGGTGSYVVDMGSRNIVAERSRRVIDDRQAVALLYNNLAMEHLANSDLAGATADIEMALALDSDNAMLWSNAGIVEFQSGHQHEAERSYLRALSLADRNFTALSNLVLLYEANGAQEKVLEYRARMQKAQERDPFALFILAQELIKQGNVEDAIPYLRSAIRLLPEQPSFYRILADAYRRLGRQQEADGSSDRAIALEARMQAKRRIRNAGYDASANSPYR